MNRNDLLFFGAALALLGAYMLTKTPIPFRFNPLADMRLKSGFGPRGRVVTAGRTLEPSFHAGLDLAARVGTDMFAPDDGIVIALENADKVGHIVRIKLDRGERCSFIHVQAPEVVIGQRVAAGERIGATGDGNGAVDPHLHFEVKSSMFSVGSTNPMPYLTGVIDERKVKT